MRIFWFIIYNVLLIPILWIFFRVYSLFNSKVRQGLKGRRDLFTQLNKSLSLFRKSGKKTVLIHSSSLGEYQQAIPLIEELEMKGYNVVVSFFSPSGYVNSKLLHDNIIKTYLPFDSVRKMKKFINIGGFDTIIFMRYDLWYNMLYEAKKMNIRMIVANARFDERNVFWTVPLLNSFKKTLYNMVDKVFVISGEDERNYKKFLNTEKTKIIKVGDSKFERVYSAAGNILKEDVIDYTITEGKKVFVVGSSWKEDEDILLPVINKIITYEKDLLTFLVPHEPKEKKIILIEKNIKELYPNISAIRFSNIGNYNGENMIIVDRMGILMNLYAYAYISYVGGGLKSGLHNILEPAIFNVPIFFGNKVKNSDEDTQLLQAGCAKVVEDQKGFYRNFRNVLRDRGLRDTMGNSCKYVFESSLGTAKKIAENIS